MSLTPKLLDASDTAARLPWPALVDEIEALLRDPTVQVPERIIMPTAGGAVLFVMPAHDGRVAMSKLITLTPGNSGTLRPLIQGEVLVFDVTTGERRLVLHGPTVTARRTAAVSALAARRLAPKLNGPMLVLGAGVQAQAHVEVFAAALGVREFWLNSRTQASADRLAAHARSLGLQARVVGDADAALADCPLVATCTPAREVVLRGTPRADAFIAAVGAFTPQMIELDGALCREVAERGRIVIDTPDAEHEAGDLIQAGIDVRGLPTLADGVRAEPQAGSGPVLFKNCGWAGWDLAAARLAVRGLAGL